MTKNLNEIKHLELIHIRKAFNVTAKVNYNVLIGELIRFVNQPNNLHYIVNNMTSYIKEVKRTDLQTLAKAWEIELNKILEGTETWKTEANKMHIVKSSLQVARVLPLIKDNLYGKKLMEYKGDPYNYVEELTREEQIKKTRLENLAKGRAVQAENRKREKAEEARKLVEAKAKKETSDFGAGFAEFLRKGE